MLTEEQMVEIREHLEKAQNPLFFFDNDDDGLTSFLLLQRFIERGKGIAIKSFPSLDVSYCRRIEELKPDYIFILDKPEVSKEFLEKVRVANIPVVWIDHHQVDKPEVEGEVYYYNPYFNDKTNEPVSYLCYNITHKKEDIWLALIGCVSDCYLPDFYEEFLEKYPEYGKKNPSSAFDVLYDSEIGKIARILDFSLKDSTTNVVNMQKLMMKVKGPSDVLEENSKTKQILERYEQINKKYKVLIEKARFTAKEKLLYFTYGGDYSLSSNIANQLSYDFEGKTIVVVYTKGDVANISIRSKGKALKITQEAIKDIEGATGGGHESATGAKIMTSDLPKFKAKVEEMVERG